MITKTFQASKHTTLEISTDCDVAIVQHMDSAIKFEIAGTDADKVKLAAEGNVVIAEYKNHSGSMNVTQINGATFIGGMRGGVSIGGSGSMYVNGQHIEVKNGTTYVNGVDISTVAGSTPQVKTEPVQIKIYAPSGIDVDVSMGGANAFVSAIELGNVSLNIGGSCKVGLVSVQDLDLDLSGTVKAVVQRMTGALNIDASGTGSIEVAGEFDSVNIGASGMAKITTSGTCNGNYRVNASGMGSIRHTGAIVGRVKKYLSGMCQVSVG